MISARALASGLLVLPGIPFAHSAAQSDPIPLAPFRSVETRNGAHAILRYGLTQRVTFLKGSPDHARITISSEEALIIDKTCHDKCGRGYELEVEIVTPEVVHVTVAHGGWLQSRGAFPRQTELGATVDNGGTLDIRSLSVDSVTASVLSGGRILTKPRTSMVASVVQGGNITYWGNARVRQSIRHGGVVEKGAPADADKPLLDVGTANAAVPPSPTVPPMH